MKTEEAKKLVEKVLNDNYDRNRFLLLIANLLKDYHDINKPIQISANNNKFNKLTLLGEYEESNKLLGIYEVEVNDLKTLMNARVAQRNLIASELKKEGYDSGLVSFYSENENQWRFSLITFESSIDLTSGNIKFIENLSPSKRQSFIAGKNEGSHTAKKQLLEKLQSKHYLSLDEIKEAFELEPVNEDFYEQYKELYLKLNNYLNDFISKDEVIAKDFQEKEVSSSDFAKKTLGQFIFIYFIQRKGWIKYKNYPENYFSFNKIFNNRKKYGDNFFNDIMEPIFYECLAKKNPNLDSYPDLKHLQFPYLNGGLFEPIRGYDWERTDIVIPDNFFKNDNITKDGDVGDGLFDIFDRFNFTVYENDSLDQDIAVDPEMLGKVFEKLLSRKERTDDGGFYTPRKIVQYMCKESLINFLTKESSHHIPSNAIELLVNYHDVLNTIPYDDTRLEIIAENAADLDYLLANIKICDPAVGSGAFPMGMLNEIVNIRNLLQPFLYKQSSVYDLKIHAISKSIYGVDLKPSSVEIARLRLWLSLIIEEEVPTPLPNLNHKLMQGNSLLSSYQGIELFNDKFLLDTASNVHTIKTLTEEISLLEEQLIYNSKNNNLSNMQKIKKQLQALVRRREKFSKNNQNHPSPQDELFERKDTHSMILKQVNLLQSKISKLLLPDNIENKNELEKEINKIKWSLIEISVSSNNKSCKLKSLINKRIQPFFIWKLEFADVFKNNNGFDIIIGNPPYILEEDNKDAFNGLHTHPCYQGKTDIWHLFVGTGLSLLRKNGLLSFIAKNQWMCSSAAANMREVIYRDSTIKEIIDFGSNMIFEDADQQTMILTLEKNTSSNPHDIKYMKFNKIFKLTDIFNKLANPRNNMDGIVSTNKIIPKIFNKSNNLTFSSSAKELILNKIDNKENFKLDPKKEIIQGIIGGPDKAFMVSRDEIDKFNDNERKFIKTFHTKTERYYTQHSDKYILYLSKKNIQKIDSFPSIKNKLSSFRIKLLKRREVKSKSINWFHLWWPRDEKFFKPGPKIVWAARTEGKKFSYTEEQFYGSRNIFFINSNRISLKYLSALLNSKLFFFYMSERLKHTGDLLQLDKNQFLKIPIFVADEIEKLEKIVEDIICLKKKNQNTDLLEKEIDQLIYALYDLNDDEILIVERAH